MKYQKRDLHNYDWRHPKKFGFLVDSDWFKAADDLKNGTTRIQIMSDPVIREVEYIINNRWYHRLIRFVSFGLLCKKRIGFRKGYEYQCKML